MAEAGSGPGPSDSRVFAPPAPWKGDYTSSIGTQGRLPGWLGLRMDFRDAELGTEDRVFQGNGQKEVKKKNH